MHDPMSRRERLTAVLQPLIHDLTHCSFATKLQGRELEAHDVLTTFRQYRFYCASFPQLLATLLARVDDELVRRPLVINLWEESGEGDLTKTHLKMLDRFISSWSKALNVIDTDRREPQGPVSIFVSGASSYLKERSLPAAFGFIGPGTEGVTSQQYEIFLDGLRKYELVKEDDLQFFSAHIETDVRHANLFWEGLHAVCGNDDGAWIEAERGALDSLKLEKEFWNQVIEG